MVKLRECGDLLMEQSSSKAEIGCLRDVCKAINSVWERRMVPVRKQYDNFVNGRGSMMRAMCGVQVKDKKAKD